jgi:hypothetical protein
MAEIPALFTQRLIVLRHHKAAMYYPFIESFAHTVVDIPFTCVRSDTVFPGRSSENGISVLVSVPLMHICLAERRCRIFFLFVFSTWLPL